MSKAQKMAVLPLAMLLTALCACAASNSMEVASDASFFGDYQNYSARRDFELVLSAADSGQIVIGLTSESGKISLTIRDGDGEIVYTGRNPPDSFSVGAKRTGRNAGRYSVELTLTRFTGYISLEMRPHSATAI